MSDQASTLNSEQNAAIDYISGPLLIIAGAGTGKTHTLVEKITHLIKKKGVKPDEILCLTFTEKAAYEMEERVDRALPYGYFSTNISTFHSFADELLRRMINHIGLNPSYSLMTQAQSVLFLKHNLFKMDLKYFRPLSNPNKFVEGLLQHFSRLKDEDISPEMYLSWAKKYSKKSDLLKEDIEKANELARAYESYQKSKVNEDKLDFDDLIYYLLKLFRKRPNILSEYQKRFKYIMVDEFQDTNIAQYELIKLLCPPASNPKLTIVGDDSQAIYKFRGASISNIMTFMEDYPHAKRVTLIDNYRSGQNILDHAYSLIQKNNPDTLESKLGISKKLVSEKSRSPGSVNFEYFENGDLEADWIVKTIQTLVKGKKIKYQDMAVLVRAHSHSDSIISSFVRSGIPYQFLGPGTLFKQAEIKEIIAYLQVLVDLTDSVSIYRVLAMDIFGIDAQDLSLITSFAKRTTLPLYNALEIYLSFFHDPWANAEYEIYKKHLPLLTMDSRGKLIKILSMIKRHLKFVSHETTGHILYYFLEDTGYLNKLVNYENLKDEKIAMNISKFFKLIKNLENNNKDSSIHSVVDFIKMSMEMGESPASYDTDSAITNSVSILSAHGAKGLEFDTVFMPSLVTGRFPTYERREMIPISEELIKEKLPEGDYFIQEERRLFYVGMTRAKSALYLSSAQFYGDGKRRRKISPFVEEALGPDIFEKIQLKKTDAKAQLTIFDFKVPEAPIINLKQIGPAINQFSYSQLEIYEVCPRQYKYQYVLKVPTPPAAAATFGSTIHTVLQHFYEDFLTDRTVDLIHMHELLETYWDPVGFDSEEHKINAKNEAKSMLASYYKSFHRKELELQNLEKLFKIKIDDELYLTGKIDRVDLRKNNHIEIIDYKTGKKPDEKILNKSLQLSIYAMAASSPGLYNKPVELIDLTFYYLQTMEKVTLQRTEKDLAEVKKRISETSKNIRSGNFDPKVGPWCKYCAFRMLCDAWR